MAAPLAFDVLARDRASKTFEKVGKSADQAGRRFGFLSARTKHMSAGMRVSFGSIASAIGGLAAASGIKSVIDQASDLGEVTSKVAVVFGKGAADVQKFASGSAAALGQSKVAALTAASTFGVFGKMAGKSGADLAKFSTRMVGLSSDLASFHNTKPEEAIEAIGAALRGESEPIRRYGVLLDDATLRNRALKMGLISTTKEALTPANKVLAAQAEIMAQTKDAQGDFKRTSGGLANQQRILAARFDDVKAKLGEGLLPIASKVAKFILDKAVPAFESLIAGISGKGTDSTDGFAQAMNDVGGAVRNAFNFIRDEVIPRLKTFGGWLVDNKDFLLNLGVAIGVVVGAVKTWAAVQAVLNVALSANPIGVIVMAIAALVAALVTAWQRSAKFREIVMNAFVSVGKVVFSVAEGMIKGFKAITMGILDLAGNLLHVLAMIPGPQQKFLQEQDRNFAAWRKGVESKFDSAIGRVQSWRKTLEKAPKVFKLKGEIRDLSDKIKDAEKKIKGVPKDKRTKFLGEIEDLKRKRKLAQEELDKLQGKKVYINAFANLPEGVKLGQLLHNAAGGRIPGAPSSRDNMISAVASGEWIINARSSQKYDALLDAINRDQVPAFASGGRVPMTAEFRGTPGMPQVGAFARLMQSTAIPNLADMIKTGLSRALSGLMSGGGNFGAGPANVSGAVALGRRMAAARGWGGHWGALYKLWQGESGWNMRADNPTSSAYGIPQALLNLHFRDPARRRQYMSSAAYQINWGLNYIGGRYGNPSAAYGAWLSRSPHWYRKGTPWVPQDGPAMLHRGEAVIPADVNRARLRGSGAQAIEFHNHGVLGSEREVKDWLVRTFDELRRQGRVKV